MQTLEQQSKKLKIFAIHALFLGLILPIIYLLWDFFHWYSLVIIAVIPFAVLVYIANFDQVSIPYLAPFLTRSYFKVKFRIAELENGISKTNKINRVFYLFYYLAALKILYFLILLFKNQQESFAELREELQKENRGIAIVDTKYDSLFSIEFIERKIENGEYVDHDILVEYYQKLFDLHKKQQRKAARYSIGTLAMMILATVISGTVTSLIFNNTKNIFAATYYFTQSSWSGGYDSSSIAAHSNVDDRTNWTTFSASSSGLVIGTDIKLATSSFWFMDDGATSTNSSFALGGGFSSGTIASTTVTGSGSGASVKLAQLTSQAGSASSVYSSYSSTAPLDDLTAQTNDTTKMWAPATTDPGEWYKIDLGSIMPISQVVAYMGKNSAANTVTRGFNIETSADNISWTNQATITGNSDFTRTINFTTTNARYVRFYITEGCSLNGFSWLVEFDVLEPSTSGTFTSAIIDMGGIADFTTLGYSATTTATSTIQIDIRAGNVVNPDGTWTSWQTNISNGGNIAALNGNRYVQYRATLNSTGTTTTPSLNSLTINNTLYYSSSSLTSSIYNAEDVANLVMGISWAETGTSTNETIRFQVRSASSSAGITSSPWCGYSEVSTSTCVGTEYFESGHNGLSIASTHPLRNGNNDQYFQYKVFLTSGGGATPTVDNVSVTYVVNAPPEVQNFTAIQGSDGYVNISYEVRDIDSASGSVTPGYVTPSFEYWNGSSWTAASTFSAGDLNNKAVNTVSTTTYTTYTATWNPNADFDGQYMNGAFAMRITINDNEAANNTAQLTSASTTLDTADPSLGAVPVKVIATTTPASVTLSATDNTTLYVKISLNSSLSDVDWAPYESATTTTLASDPDTVYYQFKDAYGNLSPASIGSVTTPETPSALMIQDTSNPSVNEYSLFFAWKEVATPNPGFGKYNILRSENDIDYTIIASSTDKAENYYRDVNVSSSTTYYYKVSTVDANGNTSYYPSSSVSGQADGTQGPGEGGGGADTIAPTISNVQVTATTTQSATIVWDTNELSNSTVGYSTSTPSFTSEKGVSTMADNAAGSGQHQVILTGLTPNTTYYFQVKSTDPSSNIATDNNSGAGYTFTTKPGAAISGVTTSQIQNNQATIVWNTDIQADSIVYYSLNSNMADPVEVQGSANLSTTHSVTISGLAENTRYYYYVKSTDSESNIATDNNGGSYYTFLTTQDTDAPTITFNSSSDITGVSTSTATISWSTDQAASSTLAYGTTESGPYDNREDNSNYNYNHSVILTGLTASTTYYFQLMNSDANGNSTTSAEFSFSTLALPDTTAPVISSVSTSTTISTATISWTTDENASSFIQYATTTDSFDSVYVEKGRSATTTSHSVTLTGLTENVTYYFRVRSTDVDGNTATDDNSGNYYSFTTTRDSTAPVISAISESPITDTSAVITWTTDEGATSHVAFGTEAGTYSSSTAINTNLNKSHSATLNNLTQNTAYYYVVVSTDASGNTATSTEGDFITRETLSTESEVQAREDAARTDGQNSSTGGGVLIIDKTDKSAPVITNIQIQSIKSDSAVVTWNTSEDANSFVKYGVNSLEDTFGQYDNVKSHTVNLKYLNPEQTYKLAVLSADSWGNLAQSDELSFKTLSLTADIELNGPSEDGNESNESILMAAVSKTIEIMNKIASQVSINTMQNALLAQYNSIEDLASIIPAPILSSEPRVELTATTAKISWRTDKEANSLVALASEGSFNAQSKDPYIQVVGNAYESVSAHEVLVYDLTPDTVYHYQLRSKAAVGPVAKSSDFIFRTPREELEINNYTVDIVSPEKAVFKWVTNTETDSEIKYTPYRNNVISPDETKYVRDKAFTTVHEITIDNFEGGTIYQLELSGKDAGGIIVSRTIPTFFTSETDLPPTISQVQTNLAISPGKDSKIQAVISWVTDEPTTSRVFFQKGFVASGTDMIEKTPLDTNYTKKHAVVITKFDPGSIYTFKVESTDSSGNTTLSKTYTILAPKQRETVFQVIMKNFESMFGWVGNVKQ